MELSDNFWKFIDDNIRVNANSLRLKYGSKNISWVNDAINQIDCRQRAKSKLPSWIKQKYFLFPSTLSFEQSTNEILARFHTSIIPLNSKVLDMTCGLGIDAMTIAKNASSITACEINPTIIECVKHNLNVCGITNMTVENKNSINYLLETNNLFDVIFVDPARRDNNNKRTFAFEDCIPDIISNLDLIAKHTSTLIIKASPMLDITQIARSFKYISDIWILSIKNECKEIVIKIDFKNRPIHNIIHAINFNADGTTMCSDICPIRNNNDINYLFNLPSTINNLWLYEPNSSLMKTFAWDFICKKYPMLKKLHKNTHLFFSDEYYPNFPGRIMKIKEIMSLKELKKINGIKANIIIRNAPFTIEKLKKQYKIQDGGEHFLYLCKYGNSENLIAVYC